jgi:cyclic-di-GMP-binding protein
VRRADAPVAGGAWISYDPGMAQTYSFDVTSDVDLQEVDNAVNQAKKEIGQRYDFKGSTATIELDQKAGTLTLTAEDAFKLGAVWEVLQTRLVRRNVPVKNMKPGDPEPASAGSYRQVITLQQGVPSDAAREIVKFLKDAKMKKVQASIQGDQLRIASASKDDLQAAMAALRGHDFGVALQFGNYRS